MATVIQRLCSTMAKMKNYERQLEEMIMGVIEKMSTFY
jgi:hypothetical protein